jgi:hypothetical protein
MSQGMVGPPPVGQAASLPTVEPQSNSDAFVPRPDPLFHTVILGLCIGVLLLSAILSIRGSTQVVLPLLNLPLPELCMLKRYTGLSCPGCGLTRCFIANAHGDLPVAVAYNPAGVFLFVIVALQIPLRSCQIWRIRHGLPELTTGIWGHTALLVFVIALLGQWTMRLLGVTF